jgi:hypothetical protein
LSTSILFSSIRRVTFAVLPDSPLNQPLALDLFCRLCLDLATIRRINLAPSADIHGWPGKMPGICAKAGRPTNTRRRVSSSLRRNNVILSSACPIFIFPHGRASPWGLETVDSGRPSFPLRGEEHATARFLLNRHNEAWRNLRRPSRFPARAGVTIRSRHADDELNDSVGELLPHEAVTDESDREQLTHHDRSKSTQRADPLDKAPAIRRRSQPGLPAKCSSERACLAESHGESNFGHRLSGLSQQGLGALDARPV